MSIAIMDGDMSEYTLVPFNLEVMKLSAWYKKQREVVVLATDFNPEKYSKFIYRKDYSDGIYPDGLLFHDNVEYGGLAFSNNRYIQLPFLKTKYVKCLGNLPLSGSSYQYFNT